MLENNAFIFSGFKAFHTLREVGLSLTTDKGDIKPFDTFRHDVEQVNNRHNHHYLYAEYNHAVGASLMAARWQQIEADGDRYDLQYRTAQEMTVRAKDSCNFARHHAAPIRPVLVALSAAERLELPLHCRTGAPWKIPPERPGAFNASR